MTAIKAQDVLSEEKWKQIKSEVVRMQGPKKEALASSLVKYIKQENLCLAEWDPEAYDVSSNRKGLWVFPKGGKSGGLLEFVMTMLDDEQFIRFYMDFIDNIIIEDPNEILTESGHKYGWVLTYVSLQNYGFYGKIGDEINDKNHFGWRFISHMRKKRR